LGLRIYDISDPSRPSDVGLCRTPGHANGIAVGGDYLYLASLSSGLRIIDISDREEPRENGYCDTPHSTRDVEIRDEYVYLAEEGTGFRIFDISDPWHPQNVGSYNTPGSVATINVSEGLIYVAECFRLGIYRFTPLQPVSEGCQISVPTEYNLLAAYPNPFNARLNVDYALPASGEVHLMVYDLSGRLVTELMKGKQVAGMHTAVLNGANLAAGSYLVRLNANNEMSQIRATLVK
jgi:hypothetical protein